MLIKEHMFNGNKILIVVILFWAFAAPSSAQVINARLSYHWGPSHHAAIYAEKFAKRVNKRGVGKIKIETYPSGQLFGIREIMGAIASGAVEMGGVVGIVSFPPLNKNYNVAGSPGLFDGYEQLRGFFHENPRGKNIWKNILKRSQAKVLAYDPVGPTLVFTTERPLTSIESFDGLKARYLALRERPLWNALGAKAVSLPTREVYTALQSGMINTFLTVPSAVKAYSWWEYAKFAQKPYVTYADGYIMVNRQWYRNLPEDVKKILAEVGNEISEEATESIMRYSEEILKEFENKHGGQIDVLSPGEQQDLERLISTRVIPELVNSDVLDKDVVEEAEAYTSQ